MIKNLLHHLKQLKALAISAIALTLYTLCGYATEDTHEQGLSFFPENISLRVVLVAHPVEFTPDNLPKVQYSYDDVTWPEVPLYDGRMGAYSKVELRYNGTGTYQFDDTTKTFLGKKCKDGFIHLLDTENEDAVFTQKFDYQKTDINYHVSKKRTSIPVWPRGGYVGNQLKDVSQSFFFFGEILGGKALVRRSTVLSQWHDAGSYPPFEAKKKGKEIYFVDFSDYTRPLQSLEAILREGQIRFEYRTIQGPLLITQQYQSVDHNCYALRDTNRFNIIFMPVGSSRKEYNLLENILETSLLPSQPMEQGSCESLDDSDEEEVTWRNLSVKGEGTDEWHETMWELSQQEGKTQSKGRTPDEQEQRPTRSRNVNRDVEEVTWGQSRRPTCGQTQAPESQQAPARKTRHKRSLSGTSQNLQTSMEALQQNIADEQAYRQHPETGFFGKLASHINEANLRRGYNDVANALNGQQFIRDVEDASEDLRTEGKLRPETIDGLKERGLNLGLQMVSTAALVKMGSRAPQVSGKITASSSALRKAHDVSDYRMIGRGETLGSVSSLLGSTSNQNRQTIKTVSNSNVLRMQKTGTHEGSGFATTATTISTVDVGPSTSGRSFVGGGFGGSSSAPKTKAVNSSRRTIEALDLEGTKKYSFKSDIFDKKIQWTAPNGTQQTYKVYQRNDIDWNLVRTKGDVRYIGKTNTEAAKAGHRPQLENEQFVTLHHIGQSSKGPIVEASTQYHSFKNQEAFKSLHSTHGVRKKHPTNPVNHESWKKEQEEYWKTRVEK